MIYNQITLNGLDLISDEYFSTLSGLPDFEKDIVTNDVFGDGEAWGRSKNKPKNPTLNIAVMRLTRDAFTKLNQAIAPNGLKRLELDTVEYGKIFGMVEIQNRMTGDSVRLISLQLIMPDPHLYAINPQSIQLGSTYSTGVIFGPGQGVIFGPGHGVVFGSATGESGTLTNSGNADAYPVITVVGTCSGIGINNITTGEHIGISAAIGDADTLVIDCRPATCGVYLNGVPHIEYKTSPGWIHCPPGDNQFSFSRNSLQNKKHCTVELKSRWI